MIRTGPRVAPFAALIWMFTVIIVLFLPNVLDQTRPWLARSVLLGARSVTAMVVVCSAWFGSVFLEFNFTAFDICDLGRNF